MKDINFFEPYLDKKGIKFNNKFILISIFAVLALSIGIYGVFNGLKIKKLTENVNEYKSLAEDPKTVGKVEIIRSEKDDLDRFETEIESMRNLDEYVSEKDIITSDYIGRITSKRPEEVFFTSLNLNSANISIAGVAQDRLSIAEFGKGLASIEDLNDVFISSISKDGVNYNFNLEVSELEESEDEIEEGNEEEVGEDEEEPEEE